MTAPVQPTAPGAPSAPPTSTGSAPAGGGAAGGDPKPPTPGEPGQPTQPDAQAATPVDTTSLEAQEKATQAPAASDGRQRGERLRKASSMLIGGDMVGGDKLVMMLGDRQPAPLQRLGTQLSDPVRYAFE